MYITTIELENWMPFKGVHKLELGPICYSVLARVDGVEGRSNWSGKTAFLESVAFAMYGMHRKRLEDEWIHEGEREGAVKLTFSNGVVIERRRVRKGATRLEVSDKYRTLAGEEGQLAVDYLVGMSKQEFLNTCYFKQKDIARIVYSRPSERAQEFSSWFRLGTLRTAESRALKELNQVLNRQGEVTTLLNTYRERMQRLVDVEHRTFNKGPVPPPRDVKEAASEYLSWGIERLKIRRDALDKVKAQCKAVYDEAVADHARHKADVKEWERHEAVVERYKKHARELSAIDELLSQDHVDDTNEANIEFVGAEKDRQAAQLELNCAKALLVGDFDGVCPVNAMLCPAKDQIISAETLNRKRYDNAVSNLKKCREAHVKSLERYRTAKEIQIQRTTQELRRGVVQAVMAECKPSILWINSHDEPESLSVKARAVEAAYIEFSNASNACSEIGSAIVEWTEAQKHSQRLEVEMIELQNRIVLLQSAAFVMGKQGAQRVIAERVLGEIVEKGNSKLRRCHIDLSFDVTWAREGSGLADVCYGCGSPFPSSQRVKRCHRCNSQRGPKLIEKSDIVFSNRSGAAEDIVGGVIRLEAGSWFRRDRGSQWGTLFVDEPFGSLDEFNRGEFCRLLLDACNPSQGNSQAFVVAHHPDVTSVLPASILVTRKRDCSTIEVIGG